MKPIVKFTLKQTVFVNVVFVILVIAGVFSVFRTPVENLPLVDIGRVFIHTVYFGASAEDIETLVTREIEEALDGLENVEFIQSHSFRNFSLVSVKLIDDSDYRDLYDEIRFRVLNIKNELPPDVDEPTFTYIDTNIWIPVIIVNLIGDVPPESLKRYAEDLRTRLLPIAHVREVDIIGEFQKEFHVSINPSKLRRYGITFQQVVAAIESANTKLPTGRFGRDDREFMLDAGKRLNSQQSVLQTIVRRDGDGNFIRVADLVASARISHRDPTTIPSVDGHSTLRLRVTKETAGSALAISRKVKQIAREFEQTHQADGISVVFTNDSTIEISDSVNTLSGNLLLGMALVVIILWVTLGFRNALLATIGIPFSFLCAVMIMKVTGMNLNTITLFSFVLVTGIMVDDAVIIIENIFRHLEMGKAKITAIVDGTAEVMLPVISAALTTILAFLPMLIMTGSTGDFFAIIPKTVTYALIASLIEALFILPIHFLDWGPRKARGHHDTSSEDPFQHLKTGLFAPLWRIYYWLVETLLDHKITTLVSLAMALLLSVAVLVLSATGIVPLIKVKFFPGNYFRYHVTVALPAGTSIETTDVLVRDISQFIVSFGKQQSLATAGTAGYYEDEDYVRHRANHHGEIVVTLPEARYRDFPDNPTNNPMLYLEYVRSQLNNYIQKKYPDANQRPRLKVFAESDGPPTGKPVNIRVTGLTLEESVQATDAIMAYMRNEPELKDLRGLDDNRPEFHRTFAFVPKQDKAFEYGLMPGDVMGIVAGAFQGRYTGEYRTFDEEVDLLVRLARTSDKGNPDGVGLAEPLDILNVPVIEDSASPILLGDLVNVETRYEASARTRYQGKPTVTITADIKSGSKLSPARVQVLVNKYFKSQANRFPEVALSYGGEFESTAKSYRSLLFAFLIALFAIYLVLASQFRNYFQPLIIISAVPFSLIGVVVGLLITRTTFTVGSFLAIVGLAGLAVNDSLILIDFMNKRKDKGKPLRAAVIESCAARMRPVLITTITTALGLLPMAIGIPHKSITWAPMATTFVAGLSSATILALLIIPVEYEFVESTLELIRQKFKR